MKKGHILHIDKSQVVAEIKNLKKSFDDLHVLKNITLDLYRGENVVVLGKSGTGKSVLIKCIVRLIEHDSGTLNVLGEDVAALKNDELNRLRKKIGFLFQSAALYDSMTVRENLEFPLRYAEKDQPESIDDKARLVEETLESVGLLEAIDKMPSELSGGMRKRVGLARTLMLKPEIILYDEPTTGLDTITSKEISNLILDVQTTYKTSSIIITHDMQCAKIAGNRIVILKDGEFIAQGTYEELEQSEDEWVRAFFDN